MRTVIPGSVSPQYIEALRINQSDFLKSITCSDETAQKARETWPDPAFPAPAPRKN